jgi:hypothetical protein
MEIPALLSDCEHFRFALVGPHFHRFLPWAARALCIWLEIDSEFRQAVLFRTASTNPLPESSHAVRPGTLHGPQFCSRFPQLTQASTTTTVFI